MIRRIPIRSGDALCTTLATDLGLLDEDGIDSKTLDICREFAFSATDADEFAYWYLRGECFSKFRSPASGSSLEAVALAKFGAVESTMAEVNRRLVDPWSRSSLDQRVWRRARNFVSGVLGRFPWEQFPWMCRFGPGASGSLRRADASHQKKWTSSVQITERARPYHRAFVAWSTLDLPSIVEVVPGNRVTTVPKSWKTDRVIAIEPDWNMFYQLGVGGLIRQRLQRFGILQPTAQELNRALARLGSWTGSLATLDLSSASDSISLALCEALLPEDWLQVILDLRSESGEVPGLGVITYAKVSSMGNGFTFELETLLFYALTMAVCGKGNSERVSVYGDDIICPTEHAQTVASILGEAGFQLNPGKSFLDGPFRESCGGHYWKGRDVTPFYLRSTPTRMIDLITLGNHIVRFTSARERREKRLFAATYRQAKRFVPRSLWGPYGMDGVWWADWDACCPRWVPDLQAYTQRAVRTVHRYTDVWDWKGSYFHKLWTWSPEVTAGRLSRSTEREELHSVVVDRELWTELPVRYR